MTMQAVHKTARHIRAPRPHAGRGVAKGLLLAILPAFGCGMGAAVLLLAVFAFLLERFSLPVTLVRPLAMAAAWIGTAVSGYVLATRLGRQKLLCGFGCGLFYGLCLVLASLISAGELCLTEGGAALLAAILLGGVIGGAASALYTNGGGRH